MGVPSHYQQEIVHWNPKIPGRKTPDVQFECVRSPGDPAGEEFGLTITGFAEGEPSRLNAVEAGEQRGEWTVATGLRFDQLEPTPADMQRMAVEGVQFLAGHFGRGVLPANLRTSSLAAVGLLGVEAAPESFSRVSSMAPFPLMNEHLGKLPLIGSTAFMRRLEVALLLGFITPIQMAHHVFNPAVRSMAGNAKKELSDYGADRNTRLDYGFHPEHGGRVAEAAVKLMLTHDWFGVFGRSDVLVRRGLAAESLRSAAERLDIDPSIVDARLVSVPGPHAPISSREGLVQFNRMLDGPPQPEAAADPAPGRPVPGLVRRLGSLTKRLAA